MKALAILLAIAATAHGDGFVAPTGWVASHTPAAQVPHFGGANATVDETRYAPAAGGVTLVVTRVAATPPSDVPAALRSEVDAFEGAARRASLSGSAVEEQGKQERIDAANKLVEATLAFRDGGVVTSSRLVIAVSATQLVAISGDCISRDGADAAPCQHALATLDPGIALAERSAPVLGAQAAEPPPMQHELSTMSESHRAPLPPMAVPPSPTEADRRPMFVGAGIVLLAGLFWWNMRRRARLANEEDPDDR